jgi:GTP:adenosylcobinamide-phosphate guanylyltransferase
MEERNLSQAEQQPFVMDAKAWTKYYKSNAKKKVGKIFTGSVDEVHKKEFNFPSKENVNRFVALILAGGKGMRLSRGYIPKSLLPVNGTPLLKNIVYQLNSLGFGKHNIKVCFKQNNVGYEIAEYVRKELDGRAMSTICSDTKADCLIDQAEIALNDFRKDCKREYVLGINADCIYWTEAIALTVNQSLESLIEKDDACLMHFMPTFKRKELKVETISGTATLMELNYSPEIAEPCWGPYYKPLAMVETVKGFGPKPAYTTFSPGLYVFRGDALVGLKGIPSTQVQAKMGTGLRYLVQRLLDGQKRVYSLTSEYLHADINDAKKYDKVLSSERWIRKGVAGTSVRDFKCTGAF